MLYLWLKAFHLVAVVSWFAGLFYHGRLLVDHAEALASPEPVLITVLAVFKGATSWRGLGIAGAVVVGALRLGIGRYVLHRRRDDVHSSPNVTAHA